MYAAKATGGNRVTLARRQGSDPLRLAEPPPEEQRRAS